MGTIFYKSEFSEVQMNFRWFWLETIATPTTRIYVTSSAKKGPYCGTNSVILDQLFLHFCDSIFLSKLRRERENIFLYMLISDKYCRPWSDAAHHAQRLIRAYDICSAIRSFFVDDVTYMNCLFRKGTEISRCLKNFFINTTPYGQVNLPRTATGASLIICLSPLELGKKVKTG